MLKAVRRALVRAWQRLAGPSSHPQARRAAEADLEAIKRKTLEGPQGGGYGS